LHKYFFRLAGEEQAGPDKARRDTDFTTMTRNHPELVQILEIFIYSENSGILPMAGMTRPPVY
jgi:hypothetical protein